MRANFLRVFLATLALCCFGAVFAACGGESNGPGTPSPDITRSTESEPPAGGEITVQHRQFASLDPHFTPFARDISIIGMISRGLYQLDGDSKLQPELAAALPDISSDGKTYTVKLKPDLKWSDGAPLTAKDVVAGIQRTCNPVVAGAYAASLFNIVGCEEYANSDAATPTEQETLMANVGVEATDDTTIVITLERPQATFATQLALWFSWPIPTHVIESPGAEWPANPTQLVYAGPFMVESYEENDNIVLMRNDNYGGGEVAKLEKITLRFIDDLDTANNAFRTGEVQVARANPAALDVLREEFGDELTAPEATAATLGLLMQAGKPPLENAALRLALSQATDRETLNRVVLKDGSFPSTSWIPEDLLGIELDPFADVIGYDPEEAKQNFAESGFDDSVELSITIADSPDAKDMAAFLQEQWKQILGINVEIIVLDGPAYSTAFGEENFQLMLLGWGHDYPDPESWVDGLFNSDGTLNNFGCSNPEIDSLLAEAKVNLDQEDRIEQYREMNQLISEGLCGVAPLLHNRVFSLVDPSLKGAVENSTSQDHYLPGDWAVEEWYLAE